MIEQILQNKEAVEATLNDSSHKHTLALLTDAEWAKLRILKSLLEPLCYATDLLGGEKYVSCSVILPTFCHLLLEMRISDADPAYVVRFKNAVTADLENRRNNFNLPWLKIATALDPRFKTLKCIPKENRDEIWGQMKTLVEDLEKDDAMKEKTGPLKQSSKNSSSPTKKKRHMHQTPKTNLLHQDLLQQHCYVIKTNLRLT